MELSWSLPGGETILFEATLPSAGGREMRLQGTIVPVEGVPQIVDLTITAPQGLVASMVASIRPAEILRETMAAARQLLEHIDTSRASEQQIRLAKQSLVIVDEPEPPRRRGRPSLTDDFLYELAADYLEALADCPGGVGTMELLADRRSYKLGRDVPDGTVRGQVERAARAGYLTPAMKGRAGRAPGPRFIERQREAQTKSKRRTNTRRKP